MKIQEYQAKQLLKQYCVSVPQGKIAFTPDKAVEIANEIGGDKWIIKAQIPAGSRLKSGGIKFANNLNEIKKYAINLLGVKLATQQTVSDSYIVNYLLIEQAINVKKEIYLCITLDSCLSRNVIIVSTKGGIEIEELAKKSPEIILKEVIAPSIGLQKTQIQRLITALGFYGNLSTEMFEIINSLYKLYESSDAQLIEINPLAITDNNELVALDAKIILDDNALFRHPEFEEFINTQDLCPFEREAKKENLSYLKLNGDIGCMVNGAGLAMATMDLIKLAGGEPANFLDIGGNANKEKVEKGIRILLKNPDTKVILINIFGGIVHCDNVARGIIEAVKNIEVKIPIIIRLAGTHAEQGFQILRTSKFNFIPASDFKKAVDLAVKSIG